MNTVYRPAELASLVCLLSGCICCQLLLKSAACFEALSVFIDKVTTKCEVNCNSL